MSGVTATLPTVLAPASLQALASQVDSAASRMEAEMEQARDRWARLAEVFQARGAEGAFTLLDAPARAAADFAEAMSSAATRLRDVAANDLPALQARRDSISARIGDVNARHEAAESRASRAESAYREEQASDPEASTVSPASLARTSAWQGRNAAEAAVGELEAEIARLRRDVEDVEDALAGELRGISGGDVVTDANGAPVGISQDYWGGMRSSYPGAGGSSTGLEQRLAQSLSNAAVSRIDWLSTADSARANAWVDKHPDFSSAVGLVDPERAQRLWRDLESRSLPEADSAAALRSGPLADLVAPRSDAGWQSGPLAQLFAVAPFAIGNLNGIAANVKDRFNRRALEQLVARDDLREDYRAQLGELSEKLENDDARLLSLFQETVDGSPRASIGWGDIDNADQIMTLTHGITEDLAALGPWSDSARDMHGSLEDQLARRGSSATTATVLFMEWDSGGMLEVEDIERPDNGAVRFAQLLRGFEANSPGVQLDVGLHSLGSTMGAQMIADNPKLVSHAWLYGSAGISGQSAMEIERQMERGEVTLHAAMAAENGEDWVAPLGRMGEHRVDPLDIPGVKEVGANGGLVGDIGSGDEPVITSRGERVDGHNSQRSELPYYRINPLQTMISPLWSAVAPWDPAAVGYLDPASESFRQTVVEMADAIEERGNARAGD